MYVYVIAYDDQGPCKIGMSADPQKRCRALQTGCPHKLKVFSELPAGPMAPAVEGSVKAALHGCKVEGGDEWFDIACNEAALFVRRTAEDHAKFCRDDMTLGESERQFALQHHAHHAKRAEDRGVDESDLEALTYVEAIDLLACEVSVPLAQSQSFNWFVLSSEAGMWLRIELERNSRRWPSSKKYQPYLDIMREHARKELVAEIWIEWTTSRHITPSEKRSCIAIWNKFVASHTEVMRRREFYDVGGVDDHVDHVWVHAVLGDKHRNDPDWIKFQCPSFAIVMRPKNKLSLHIYPWELSSLPETEEFEGVVYSPLPNDFWETPIRPWLRGSASIRDRTLAEFLEKPDKRFPTPRQWVGNSPPPCTKVTVQLPEIDEDGLY